MKSPFPPADGPAWNEPERDSHAPFPVPRWQATCLPRITISLSFANSEFTFANILRLNSYDLPVGQAVYAIDAFPDGRSALAYRMDRRRWLQYERSQRAPDRCLFGAAPQRREEPAQRTSAFLSSREENGEDRCWSAALRLDRFRLAEAPARDYESVGVPGELVGKREKPDKPEPERGAWIGA